MDRCYHYELHESGECPTCHTEVKITEGWYATTEMPMGNLSGSRDYADQPSTRMILADGLGILMKDVVLEEVNAVNQSYQTKLEVFFHLFNSKVQLKALVFCRSTTVKDPSSAEYEKVEVDG